MEDTEIVALYWARDQRAITESEEKYGTYCASIARNILGPEDTEECVSDTWFRAWNAMPPQRPSFSPPSSGGSPVTWPLTVTAAKAPPSGKKGDGSDAGGTGRLCFRKG